MSYVYLNDKYENKVLSERSFLKSMIVYMLKTKTSYTRETVSTLCHLSTGHFFLEEVTLKPMSCSINSLSRGLKPTETEPLTFLCRHINFLHGQRKKLTAIIVKTVIR